MIPKGFLKNHGLSGTIRLNEGCFFYCNRPRKITEKKLGSRELMDCPLEIARRWPEAQKRAHAGKASYLWADALRDWQQDKMPSKANLGFRQATVDMWLSHDLPNNLLEVDAKDIQKFLLWLEKTPIEGVNRGGHLRCKNTVNKRLGSLRYLFKVTQSYHGVAINPFSSKGPTPAQVKNETVNRRAFTIDEIDKILGEMIGWHRAIAALGKYTAMRFGDCVKTPWSRLDFERQRIKPFQQSKTGQWHNGFVIRDESFWEIMESWRKEVGGEGAYMFPKQREQYLVLRTKSYPVGNWNTQLKKTKIKTTNEDGRKNAGFHSFRSYAVTYMRMLGMPDSEIIKFTGHMNTAMLEIYDNPTEEQRLERAIQLREKLDLHEAKAAIKHGARAADGDDLLPVPLIQDPDKLELLAELIKARVDKNLIPLLASKILSDL